MRTASLTMLILSLLCGAAAARSADDPGPQLTIYNQDFALVKESRTLPLEAGDNEVRFTDVTALMEPDSVVLRDPDDPDGLRILEQNYQGDTLSEGYLLQQHEGKTIEFHWTNPATGATEIRMGRLIRSGYTPRHGGWHMGGGRAPFAPAAAGDTPIVEVDGKMQFWLPGRPVFEALGADAILKPALFWKLWSDRAGKRDVEVSYLTGGMRWEATYNLVSPEAGDHFDLVGWVTLANQSGTEFPAARVKLMAGDVSKIRTMPVQRAMDVMMRAEAAAPAPAVTEKAFDEYHLYTLQRRTTLRDREIKQVEFCRGAEVPGKRLYVYDGAQVQAYGGPDYESVRNNPSYGTQSNTKIYTMLEFENSEEAGLGIPLPRGTMKLYRTDSDGGREFIGENVIDHTPADETVRIYLGNAFDLVGERRQISFTVDRNRRTAEESFEIKVRNHKKEAVEVRIVEHLYRWVGWKITASSDPFTETDSRTVEFRVGIPADGEKVVTYEVRYTW